MNHNEIYSLQLIQTVTALDSLCSLLGFQLDAIVLHNQGDNVKLVDLMTNCLGVPTVPRTDGRSDTRINGIQVLSRFEV
jgi:hypothetical protein